MAYLQQGHIIQDALLSTAITATPLFDSATPYGFDAATPPPQDAHPTSRGATVTVNILNSSTKNKGITHKSKVL
jgi:hypothetical protein